MKKRVSILCLMLGVIATLAFSSCEKKKPDWTSYFPLQEGNVWVYDSEIGGGMNLIMTFKVTGTEKINEKDCRILEAFVHNNSVQKEFYELNETGLIAHKRVLQGGMREINLNPPEMMLKFPMVKGDTWTWDGKVVDGNAEEGSDEIVGKFTFVVEDEEEIEVPAGKFNCFKVKLEGTTSGTGSQVLTSTRWFAKDVGMVKEESAAGPITVVAKLKAYRIDGKVFPEGANIDESSSDDAGEPAPGGEIKKEEIPDGEDKE